MNVSTPTITVTTTLQNALNTSPVDSARHESGKQLALDEQEFNYLEKVRKCNTTGTIIFLPLDAKFLNESDMTKERVIDLWKRLNKSQPDEKYTKTIKQEKKYPLTSLTKLPITFEKFSKLKRFQTEAKKLMPTPEQPVRSGVVPIDPTQKVTKISIPKAVAWETEGIRKLVYPLLDLFVNGIPPEEIPVSNGKKSSEKGWTLWTTAEPGIDIAILCVQSQRIAHTMAECLKTCTIAARVSQEDGEKRRTFVTVRITPNALPTKKVIRTANEALVNEYKRLLKNDAEAEEMQKSFSKLCVKG